MTIQQLDLSSKANLAAIRLQHAFPDITFTSGRRTVAKQAQVMAHNVIKNRRFIEQVYLQGTQLQAVVDHLPTGASQSVVEANLYESLSHMTPSELLSISKHFFGDAFDIMPVVDSTGIPTSEGRKIIDYIRSQFGEAKLLLMEGGQVIWHVQFPASVTAEV